MEVFLLVTAAWVFSVCLHEFGHALVAFYGGDYTVKEKGYLTLNPIHYTHPVYSLVMPLVFLVLGGMGLPGGAVLEIANNNFSYESTWGTFDIWLVPANGGETTTTLARSGRLRALTPAATILSASMSRPESVSSRIAISGSRTAGCSAV